jgi:hypothetical protein
MRSIGGSRGESASDSTVIPLRPVGTAVCSDRPILAWKGDATVSQWLVVILDERNREVARAKVNRPPGKDDEVRWSPARPLPRGGSYRWQAASTKSDSVATTPISGFTILSQTDCNRITMTAGNLSGHPDLLGALYARYGLVDDAVRALSLSRTPQARALMNSLLQTSH